MSRFRVLVTGSSGLLGTALQASPPPGYDLVLTSRKEADLEAEGTADALIRDVRPDCVIHAAAVVGGIRYNMESPEELRDRNNAINDNVLEAAFKYAAPKVISFLSSCLFPEAAPEPWDESMIHSGKPDARQWGYAEAKRALDLKSRELTERSKAGSRFVTLMPTALYGPGDNYHPDRSHVIPATLLKIRRAKQDGVPPVFWGTGKPRREFLFSQDMAQVVWWAVEKYADLETLIVAPPCDESIAEIVQLTANEMAYQGPISWDVQRPEGRLTRRTNTAKFRRFLPNFRFTPFEKGLAVTIQDFQSRYPHLRGLESPKAIFLDRDGVLNRKPVRARYVRRWEEFEWMPGAIEAVRELKRAGYLVIVISNQAGVGGGQMTESDLQDIHRRMQEDLNKAGASLDAFYYCPHAVDAGCGCRKPKPGLLQRAQRDFSLDLSATIFIGDDPKDLEAGKAAGSPTYLVNPDRPLLTLVKDLLAKRAAA